MNKPSLIILFLIYLFGTVQVQSHDYPTIERVKFVHECMALHGGQIYENMYSCSCMNDHIANNMNFDQYIKADAYQRMRNMRGERGGLFRSSKTARDIRAQFNQIKSNAQGLCFRAITKPTVQGAKSAIN